MVAAEPVIGDINLTRLQRASLFSGTGESVSSSTPGIAAPIQFNIPKLHALLSQTPTSPTCPASPLIGTNPYSSQVRTGAGNSSPTRGQHHGAYPAPHLTYHTDPLSSPRSDIGELQRPLHPKGTSGRFSPPTSPLSGTPIPDGLGTPHHVTAAEVQRLRQLLTQETARRLQLEADKQRLQDEVAALKTKLDFMSPPDWLRYGSDDKERKLLEQNAVLRDMSLNKICFQCNQAINCVNCTPFASLGLEVSEACNYGFDGICVVSVKDQGPAHCADIKEGDIITEIDGTPVRDGNDLRQLLRRLVPLQTVEFVLFREAPDGQWLRMSGQAQLQGVARLPSAHRVIYHHVDQVNSSLEAPLGGSPRAARERSAQRATSPPPFKTTSPVAPESPTPLRAVAPVKKAREKPPWQIK
eukprot:TRINITY_DN16385_c0_g1_i1.p1 TRINITY_DN16385_c0_g1~~TRINITY_DN16385_c0_g1_i1.p1  ORF type:complete len:412 (+),score=57.04 TRINITY_DN16385_c0_g1_i1:160-1395(+)